MRNKAGQTGMTLIEIMIAMLIGVFLIGGVLQIFVGTKHTNRMLEELSRIQENGRYALGFLADDIRSAGFMGCPPLRPPPLPTLPIVPIIAAGIPALTNNTFVFGVENVTANWSATACAAGNCIAGSDAITIRYAEGCGANLTAAMANVNANIQIPSSSSCRFTPTGALLISSCSNVDIFRPLNDSSPIQHPALSFPYGIDAELYVYHSYTYFIRESTSGAPGRSLWRIDDVGGAATELIEGIEDMQILYGVDALPAGAPDESADYYVPADQVANWSQVVSVRISLLAVSFENITSQAVAYDYNGSTIIPADNRLRRVFSSTVTVRNRISQ
jgi:type IV pilus assembly protein PilW